MSITPNLSNKQNGVAFLFLSPWILGFVFLTLGPLMGSLYLSFADYDLFTASEWAGTKNYAKLLGGSVAVAIMWRQIFSYDGIINHFLWNYLGYDAPSWITNPDYALGTLVLLAAWQFGAPMVIFLAGLKQIPQDMYDAAAIDGARPVQQFFYVTIPLLTPIIFFNFVMQTIGAFQAFTPSYIISDGSGGPADSTLFYTLYLYEQAFTDFQMGYASAIAWVLVAIIAAATSISFLSAKYWVHYGDEN